MRIIGGALKRRKLNTPPDATTTRPMPDHVRLALFNLLRGHTEEVAILDVFAGTGSIGLEAVSRGASRAVFLERDRRIARILQQNIDELDVADRCELHQADAMSPAALMRCPRPVHLIFMDPPYALVTNEQTWERIRTQAARLAEHLTPDGFLMIRTPAPAVHEPEPPQEEDPRERSRREHRTHKPRRQRTDTRDPFDTNEVEVDPEAPETWFAEDPSADPDTSESLEAPPSPPKRTPANLAIEGLEGPETHTYGKTAVHLYARPRPDSMTDPDPDPDPNT